MENTAVIESWKWESNPRGPVYKTGALANTSDTSNYILNGDEGNRTLHTVFARHRRQPLEHSPPSDFFWPQLGLYARAALEGWVVNTVVNTVFMINTVFELSSKLAH